MTHDSRPGLFAADALRFGGVLAVLSVIAMLVMVFASSESQKTSGMMLTSLPLGAGGMFMGGAIAYHLTRSCSYGLERIVLMTLIAPGMGFVIASLPFLWILIIGAFMAWGVGVLMFGVPAFLLTALVSTVYVAVSALFTGRSNTGWWPVLLQRDAPSMKIFFSTLTGVAALYLAISYRMDPAAFR